MKENSELLAQQAKSASMRVGSGPTIELITLGAREDGALNRICPPDCAPGAICAPNCLPYCLPSCPPTIFPK